MLGLATHGSQLAIGVGGRNVILVHDVGQVYPLVASAGPVCRRVGLGAGNLTDANALRGLRAHQHGRFAVARARRLRSQGGLDEGSGGRLRVGHAWLHNVDLPTIVAILNVAQQALHLFVAAGGRDIGQVGTVDVLDIAQLADRLVNHSLLVVAGVGDSPGALAVRDAGR